MSRRAPTGLGYAAALLFASQQLVLFLPLLLALGVVGVFELSSLLGRRLRGAALAAAIALSSAYLFAGLAILWRLQWTPWTHQLAPWIWSPWPVIALVITWATDVSAYAGGTAIGRRPITPRLSPGKTWEGTIIGWFVAAVAAYALAVVFDLGVWPLAVLVLLGGPAAFVGDLIESALKRYAGVKDSGHLLPGHGGVLDRIDSVLLVAPVVLLASAVA